MNLIVPGNNHVHSLVKQMLVITACIWVELISMFSVGVCFPYWLGYQPPRQRQRSQPPGSQAPVETLSIESGGLYDKSNMAEVIMCGTQGWDIRDRAASFLAFGPLWGSQPPYQGDNQAALWRHPHGEGPRLRQWPAPTFQSWEWAAFETVPPASDKL